jgi:hypothetical protein
MSEEAIDVMVMRSDDERTEMFGTLSDSTTAKRPRLQGKPDHSSIYTQGLKIITRL